MCKVNFTYLLIYVIASDTILLQFCKICCTENHVFLGIVKVNWIENFYSDYRQTLDQQQNEVQKLF